MTKLDGLAGLRRAWDSTDAAPEDDEARALGVAKCNFKLKAKKRGVRDRFTVLNNFVDYTAGSLPRSEVLVWLVLYRDTRDGTAETAQADIVRRTGLGKRTVQLAIKKLETSGLVKCVRRGGLRRGVSRYRVFPITKQEQMGATACA